MIDFVAAEAGPINPTVAIEMIVIVEITLEIFILLSASPCTFCFFLTCASLHRATFESSKKVSATPSRGIHYVTFQRENVASIAISRLES